MKLTRKVFPVGQGGMYLELLSDGANEFSIVYDCGGTNEVIINREVDQLCSVKDKHINAVFISHFHIDHINGLQYLLSQAAVDYLIIPQITDDQLAEAILFNSFQYTEDSFNNFIIHICRAEGILDGTKIIRIPPTIPNTIDIVGIVEQLGNSAELVRKQVFAPDFPSDWLFIPYNPIVPEVKLIDELKQILKVEVLDFSKLPQLLRSDRALFDKIKDLYRRKFKGNHNSYSMALFSGNMNGNVLHCYSYSICPCNQCPVEVYKHAISVNALYSGDIEESSVTGMQTFYGALWETIGTIQVPHHGSFNNFIDVLYKVPRKGFISVGNGNRYHHPGVQTLVGMSRNSCMPVLVTEDSSTICVDCYDV